jgi:endonuclease/exonuclease/phosphatase family metal-dependent hydrolase
MHSHHRHLVGQLRWRAINFYNDIDDKSAISTLLSLDLDSTIPTIIMGDFNLHSRNWSSAEWTPSSASHRLEEWLATQTFSLLPNQEFPRTGENGARDSTIDLVWCNFAASRPRLVSRRTRGLAGITRLRPRTHTHHRLYATTPHQTQGGPY